MYEFVPEAYMQTLRLTYVDVAKDKEAHLTNAVLLANVEAIFRDV